ncbi:hypothetical protein EHI44_24225 [Rhizobium leguminosarum]|uniref:hypothetical protein n=1 Tax=Rhizobium leguminosarum TaxID=384 RepID=UPI000FF00610|nr:hypothetical protein [Rhizobium leguminosarum]RWY82399.1 hypothetical protein EHI44_24225 [Rhizobium leguminosarum]
MAKKSGAFNAPFSQNAASSVEKHTTKNIMSPLLWASAIIIGPCLTAAALIEGYGQWMLLGAVFFVIFFVLFFYAFFAFFDRDRLQSEEYRIIIRNYELLLQNGKSPAVLDLTSHSTQTPNTYIEANKTGGEIDA